jgi:MarR family transcriptional regulator, organic hydroperoxide resistance regulator
MHNLDEFRYLVLAAQREGNRAMADLLRPAGLTTAQAEAMSVLANASRPLTVRELGQRLVCEQGSPSRLAQTLVAKGMAVAGADDRDRRKTTLKVTPEGRRVARLVAKAEARLFEMLAPSIDPADLATASGLLRSIVADLPAGQALALRMTTETARDR